MRICVLCSAPGLDAGDHRRDPSVHLPEHAWESHTLTRAGSVREVRALAERGFDVFVNLCDGARGEDRAGVEVVQTLQRLGVAYTGADEAFYEPTREAMKAACRARGVATPRAVFAADLAAAARAGEILRFPLIVKHPCSYSSVGMTRASRVEDREQLQVQAARTIASYGRALIEEFIEGREFTVLVAENPADPQRPIAFVPAEFGFPPGECFKHHDLKWVDYHQMTWAPVLEPQLAARLQDISRKQFLGLGGRSYGRCDIRMDSRGELYMLEINPNCGVFYAPEDPGSADVILLADRAGHRGFLELILQSAVQAAARKRGGEPRRRQQRRRPALAVAAEVS